MENICVGYCVGYTSLEPLALCSIFVNTHASSGLKQACEKDLVKLTIVDATNQFQLGAVSE